MFNPRISNEIRGLKTEIRCADAIFSPYRRRKAKSGAMRQQNSIVNLQTDKAAVFGQPLCGKLAYLLLVSTVLPPI